MSKLSAWHLHIVLTINFQSFAIEINDAGMENYYKILNCNENATQDEIKHSYQKLVKRYHPDKSNNILSETYQKIDTAWQILRNIESRKLYDAKLLNSSINCSYTYAKLGVDEMKYDVENELYTYNCRCGGTYSLSKDSLEEFEEDCVVGCDECSFTILVVKFGNCET